MRILILLLFVAIIGAAIFFPLSRKASAPRPYGIVAREPWKTANVKGSPEAPPPFETQRIFPKLRFDRPVDLEFAPGSKRIFVAQEKGQIFSFLPDDPNIAKADVFFDALHIKGIDTVPDCKGVENVLALTFHPQFEKNHYCYIEYNLAPKQRKRNFPNGARLSRFTVNGDNPPRVDMDSEVRILEWLGGGHNGCTLKFGADGFLYISTGDAADPDPPDDLNTGQDVSDLLSSVLRIDVDHPSEGKQYSIPADNPFVKVAGARPEVWVYGFRNAFRMNFDPKTGNLWVGDVGWELWEMIHCVKAGGNYGWSIMEGVNPVHPDGKRGPNPEISKPQAAVFHTDGASMTGGLVYRGKKFPELVGHYIFGDWQTSRIWEAKCIGPKEDTLEPYREIVQCDQRLVCFTADADGEPIILDHGAGGLYRLVPNPSAAAPAHFPRKLSETGLFSSVKEQKPAAGVQPFSINAPQWLDGASAERWVALPGNSKTFWGKGVWGDDKPAWPRDSVLARTISLPRPGGAAQRVETQLLHFDGRQWHGYSYAWNDAQDDAELIGAAGAERPFMVADASAANGERKQLWHYPSRTQCMTCHNVWCDYALAFNAPQLDRNERFLQTDGKMAEDNQVRAFRQAGLLHEPRPPERRKPGEAPPEKETLANPYDPGENRNERARSYLHVNCSHCHRFGGGGTALIDVRKEMHGDQLKAIGQRPLLGDFGIDNAKLIAAGDPARSVLLFRTSKLGRGRMPHIGSDVVDERGNQLLEGWIASLQAPAADAATEKTRAAQRQDAAVVESVNPPAAELDAALGRMLSTTSGALTLLNEIQSGKLAAPVRQAALAKAVEAKGEPVRDLFRRFDPRDQNVNRLGSNIDSAKLLALKGSAERGKKIFFEAGTNGVCAKCHKLEEKGVAFGPDLSHIGTKYNRAQLLESIVEPSKTIAEGFSNYLLRKKDGEVLQGLVVSKSETELVFKCLEKEYRIPTGEIQKMAALPISAMPEGLLQDMTAEDAADLLEYLSSLK